MHSCQDPSLNAACQLDTLRATFIEVFAKDVFADSSLSGAPLNAVETAHLELVAPGP